MTTTHPQETVYGRIGDATVPLQFSSAAEEYKALRERAAVLDLSGNSLIELTGSGAVELAQRVLARDVEYLTSDRCMMSLVLSESGQVVDQVVAFGREDGILLESSTGAGSKLLEHLHEHNDGRTEIIDRSAELTVIGLEGPYAWGVVGRLIDGELASLPFESVVDTTWNDVELLFARTGFTGEYGYQVIVPRDSADTLWRAALEHAAAAGQETLEVAMLEVRQIVPRHELAGSVSVLEAGANWLIDITKDDFVGKDAVVTAFEAGGHRKTIGFSGGAEIPAPGTPVYAAGEQVGEVVHAAHSAGLGAPLGLARIDPELAAAGLTLTVGDTEVVTLTSPYVVPKSWGIPII